MTKGSPHYTHSCTQCRFLGKHEHFDLYVHDEDADAWGLLVARYEDGHDAFISCTIGDAERARAENEVARLPSDAALFEAYRLLFKL